MTMPIVLKKPPAATKNYFPEFDHLATMPFIASAMYEPAPSVPHNYVIGRPAAMAQVPPTVSAQDNFSIFGDLTVNGDVNISGDSFSGNLLPTSKTLINTGTGFGPGAVNVTSTASGSVGIWCGDLTAVDEIATNDVIEAPVFFGKFGSQT